MQPPRENSDDRPKSNKGWALILVGLFLGIPGFILFDTYGPSQNGGLLGMLCMSTRGVLFLVGIGMLATAKSAMAYK
jgi:hypothetical protein